MLTPSQHKTLTFICQFIAHHQHAPSLSEIAVSIGIQRLVARNRHEQRLYVVTVEPELEDAIHSRWPKIMSG